MIGGIHGYRSVLGPCFFCISDDGKVNLSIEKKENVNLGPTLPYRSQQLALETGFAIPRHVAAAAAPEEETTGCAGCLAPRQHKFASGMHRVVY